VHLDQNNTSGAARLWVDTAGTGDSEVLRLTGASSGKLTMVYERGSTTWNHFINGNGLTWEQVGDSKFTYQMNSNGTHTFTNGINNTLLLSNGGALTVSTGAATNVDLMTLDTAGNLTIAGAYSPSSDKNIKEDFATVDPREVLATVAEMPITSWKYIADENGIRHMGPMAQDFYAAFGLGADNRHIATIDSDGVALAAIKGLNEIVTEKNAEIDDLKARLAKLEALMQKLAD